VDLAVGIIIGAAFDRLLAELRAPTGLIVKLESFGEIKSEMSHGISLQLQIGRRHDTQHTPAVWLQLDC
jgi:large-conductance mechanosensitive channel